MEIEEVILAQAVERSPGGVELIIYVVAGLAALWIALKVLRVVTNVFARLIWIVALVGAVVWVILSLK